MIRPRIGLVHALLASIAPVEAVFSERWPEAQTVSLYDQSLYADFNESGRITPELFERIRRLLAFSAESGADAVLFTGSLFGEAVEAARPGLSVPVLTAYEAMIEDAFSGAGDSGPRIGILATAASTIDMMKPDIAEYAVKKGLRYEIDARHVAGAIDALLCGERDEHDALVLSAARNMHDCDVLMLAQFSMAPIASRIPAHEGRRVLSSPASAVAKMKRALRFSRARGCGSCHAWHSSR